MVAPVYVIRYWMLSPAGETKENEDRAVGSKSSNPRTPVSHQPKGTMAPMIIPPKMLIVEALKLALLKQ